MSPSVTPGCREPASEYAAAPPDARGRLRWADLKVGPYDRKGRPLRSKRSAPAIEKVGPCDRKGRPRRSKGRPRRSQAAVPPRIYRVAGLVRRIGLSASFQIL